MKCIGLTLTALALLTAVGCSSSPVMPGQLPPVASDSCKDRLGPTLGSRLHDPGVGWVVVATVMTLGFNVVSYEVCERDAALMPAPESMIVNGVYHSEDGLFSVRVPEPTAKTGEPDIKTWQRHLLRSDSVLFSMKNGIAYAADVNKDLRPNEASMSNEQYADSLMISENDLNSYIIGSVKVVRLYKESVILNDDMPATMEVFSPKKSNMNHEASATTTQPDYLIYYVSKTDNDAIVLSILWRGECPNCSSGPESEIRKMSPGIAQFINSFRVINNGVVSHEGRKGVRS